jgi:hypothetical protein
MAEIKIRPTIGKIYGIFPPVLKLILSILEIPLLKTRLN